MVMTVTQKAVAILALIFFVLLADFIVILGVSVKMREALNNAIDGAVMVNLDAEPLRYTDMNSLRERAEQAFYEILKNELGLDNNFRNKTFFRHGVKIEHLYIGWEGDFPLVESEISVQIDTVLLGRFLFDTYIVRLNSLDKLYWQWA